MKQETIQSKLKNAAHSAVTIKSFADDLKSWNEGKTGGQRLQAAANAVAKIIGAAK